MRTDKTINGKRVFECDGCGKEAIGGPEMEGWMKSATIKTWESVPPVCHWCPECWQKKEVCDAKWNMQKMGGGGMTQRCPHCRQPISFSVTVSVTDTNDINADTRNKEIVKIKKKFPKMSTRAIAEAVGCSFATVSRVLREAAE